MFQQIKREPYDRSIEQRIRQQDAELNRKKQAAEKKIKAANTNSSGTRKRSSTAWTGRVPSRSQRLLA